MTPDRRRIVMASVGVLALVAAAGARRRGPSAADNAPVPPGLVREAGVFADISPRWSRDGTRIAFLRRTTDRGTQVCVAAPDLARADALTPPEVVFPDLPPRTGRDGITDPDAVAWTPDGAGLAVPRSEWYEFARGARAPGSGLWLLNAATRRIDPLAVHPPHYGGAFRYYRAPAWMRGGRIVAFIAEAVDGASALCVRPLRGSDTVVETTRFDTNADIGALAVSPDGRRLAFRQRILRAPTADPIETLRVIEPGGLRAGRVLTLTPAAYRRMAHLPEGVRTAPRITGIAWSPDQRHLAIALAPDAGRLDRCGIWTLDLPTRAMRQVSPPDGRAYLDPVWIDAGAIGVLRRDGDRCEAAAIAANGTGMRVLTALPGPDYDWSPDRTRIVCAAPSPRLPETATTLRIVPTGLVRAIPAPPPVDPHRRSHPAARRRAGAPR